jgi:putative membrane protein
LQLVIRWLIVAAGVWAAAQLIDGIVLEGWQSILIVAGILALLNVYVRPVLRLLSLPLTIITFGLFLLVINTALLAITAWIAGQFAQIHFSVDGFLAAFLGALVISVVTFVITRLVNPSRFGRAF